MAENELVYVPQSPTWYKNENFWMGVASSFVAGVFLWYLIHTMYYDTSEVKDVKDNKEENDGSL